MVIVDSSVWIDYFADVPNRQTSWLERNADSEFYGLTDLIFCEVLQGTRDEFSFARVRAVLSKLEIFDTGGAVLALAAARNYRLLRTKGHTIRTTIDLLIATFCIESGCELLHRDRGFDPFEKHLGLRVVHP
jgi:hypothetical protein